MTGKLCPTIAELEVMTDESLCELGLDQLHEAAKLTQEQGRIDVRQRILLAQKALLDRGCC